MNYSRVGALAIGILFAIVNIGSFVGETYEHRDHALDDIGVITVVLLFAGPFTFVAATLLGLRRPALAGYWLIAASVVSAILFAIQLPHSWLVATCIWIAPLLVAGLLWVRSTFGVL